MENVYLAWNYLDKKEKTIENLVVNIRISRWLDTVVHTPPYSGRIGHALCFTKHKTLPRCIIDLVSSPRSCGLTVLRDC